MLKMVCFTRKHIDNCSAQLGCRNPILLEKAIVVLQLVGHVRLRRGTGRRRQAAGPQDAVHTKVGVRLESARQDQGDDRGGVTSRVYSFQDFDVFFNEDEPLVDPGGGSEGIFRSVLAVVDQGGRE